MKRSLTISLIGIAIGFCVTLLLMAASGSELLPWNQATEKTRWTDPYCNTSGASCGAIVYGNAGAYTVNPVNLNARSSQPGGNLTNPNCAAVSTKLTGNVNVDEYVVYVVPADCAYKLKIKIVTANSKDLDLFLTPGCQIVTKSKGTTISNSWESVKATWIDGGSGDPVDKAGNKCGKEGNM